MQADNRLVFHRVNGVQEGAIMKSTHLNVKLSLWFLKPERRSSILYIRYVVVDTKLQFNFTWT